MELIRGGHNLGARHRGCVATIGNFDGVHRGHAAVVTSLRQAGERLCQPPTVITFEPHPREFFAPAKAPPRLTRLRDKLAALDQLGVARVLCLPFGWQLASQSPQAFVDELLVERLGVSFLMVGDDFRFGRDRAGDFAFLAEAGERRGFEVTRMPTVLDDDERISSTRIREALARRDLATAERLLGRAFGISGRVAHGDRIGRELGWPTVNLPFARTQPPLAGVYAVRVDGPGLRDHPGVASLGTRPVVGGESTLLEVHLFDYQGDLYGAHLTVRFKAWIRDEANLPSMAALRDQIGRDAEQARALLGAPAG
jgi:riboflavin kinase/FMN adenylyltransferase